MINRDSMCERLLRYVKVETTSDEDSESTPSSACQWNLARILEADLKALGLKVSLSEYGYVYGMLPDNLDDNDPRKGNVPTIGFISHMDVSPAVSGKDVKPIVHKNYQGNAIVLPDNTNIVLTPETDAPLGDCVGCDIITASGTTLLGADDKAGVSIIFAMLEALLANPEIKHGPVAVAFTPDEEVGRGVDQFELDKFGAEVAYTVDGESLGEVEDETFCADAVTMKFTGCSVHPGYAKDKMVNALKLAAEVVARLPKDTLSPETTCGREGFVHPVSIQGSEETAVLKFIVRDFTDAGVTEKGKYLEGLANQVAADLHGNVETEIKFQYRNMKSMIDKRPEVCAYADEAVAMAGLNVIHNPIRGGTDGSRLSFMGLPTPNIFTGGHNFHGLREWVALDHMVKSAEVCLNLVKIWKDKGEIKGLLTA